MARKYANVSEVATGTVLVADGGFDCLVHGEAGVVQKDADRNLFVPCTKGRHYLDGQLDEHDQYVGFAPMDDAA